MDAVDYRGSVWFGATNSDALRWGAVKTEWWVCVEIPAVIAEKYPAKSTALGVATSNCRWHSQTACPALRGRCRSRIAGLG